MKNRKLRVVAAVLALAAAALAGADRVESQCAESTGTCEEKRLYPKTANPDGSLNCAPKCGLLGPCC
ncbi:MAG TPA: hypothetical protein VF142_17480 [Longimicrobium sp.]